MENVMNYGMESKLRLPSCFIEVTDKEMEYLDGGATWQQVVDVIAAIVGLAVAIVGVTAIFVTLPFWLTVTAGVAGAVSAVWGAGRVFGWW